MSILTFLLGVAGMAEVTYLSSPWRWWALVALILIGSASVVYEITRIVKSVRP